MKIEDLKIGQTVYVKGIITDIEKDGILNLEIHTSENNFYVNSSDVYASVDQPKPEVPQFVADWLKYCKENKLTLLGAFYPISEHGIGLAENFENNVRKCTTWAKDNQDIFSSAWLAYPNITVEKEKLYTVEIPNPNAKGHNKIYLCKDGNTGKVYLCKGNFNPKKNKNLRLTESEIRKDFDWAWQFAKEVTE